MTISRQDAITLAKKLHANGKTHAQIGPILAKEGFVSKRTGEPLTQGGVSALITQTPAYRKRAKKKTHRRVAAATGPVGVTAKAARGKLDAVSRLLGLKDVPAEDRIAMVQLLLG